MNRTSVACPFCRRPGSRILVPAEKEGVMQVTCPCLKGKPLRYVRFPALDRAAAVAEASPTQLEDDSSCYHHPDRQAQAVCEDCGMFICGLCEVKDESDTPLCLSCFSRRTHHDFKLKPDQNPKEGQMVWDRVAIATAVFPILLFYFTVITAPLTLYFVLRYWKGHPYSYFPTTRVRFVFAFLIALAQIVGWIALVVTLVSL